MWQTKYVSAVLTNLGLGMNFRPYRESYFLWAVVVLGLAENNQLPQNLSAQLVCPSPKVMRYNENRLHECP